MMTPAAHDRRRRSRRGFTLIELGIVVLIISLIISFVLVVGFSGVESARIRATQALVTKLDGALNDRLQALVSVRVTPNGTHRWLAAINPPGAPAGSLPWGLTSEQRAVAIARLDQIRMELPDVFYIQTYAPGANGYPVNFAGLPFPPPRTTRPFYGASQSPANYVLPIGNRLGPGFSPASGDIPAGGYTPAQLDPDGDGNTNTGPGAFVGLAGTDQVVYGGVPDQGIYGASFAARSALHSLIGYLPTGTNLVDDDGDGLVDELDEGVPSGDLTANNEAAVGVSRFLENHDPKTARSETLYAILVQGTGPLGSVFSRGDFTTEEVQDTDDDGLPEFVDGWGEPLQFYRWPVAFPAPPLQRGAAPYVNVSDAREAHPLDPNKQLVAPAWWGDNAGGSPAVSAKSIIVQSLFTSFTDPNWVSGASPPASAFWDISGYYPRRSFACRFLIVSSGPDRALGLKSLTRPEMDSYLGAGTPDGIALEMVGDPGDSVNGAAAIPGENWGIYTNLYPSTSTAAIAPPDVALDNISNLNFQSDQGGVK